jgi:hypothetical protein
MWGLVSSIQRRLAPRPIAGFVFQIQAIYGTRSAGQPAQMGAITDDRIETGMSVSIAVKNPNLEIAQEWALASARKMAPNAEITFVNMRNADQRDLPDGSQIYVKRRRHFGFPPQNQSVSGY